MMMAMLLVLLISIASAGSLSLLQQEKKRLDGRKIAIAKNITIDQIIHLFFTEKKQLLSLKTILIESDRTVNDKFTCSVASPPNEVSYISRRGDGVRFVKASTGNAPKYTPKSRYNVWLISKNTHHNKVCGQHDHFRITQQPLNGSERCRLYSVMLCVSALENPVTLSRVVNIEMIHP